MCSPSLLKSAKSLFLSSPSPSPRPPPPTFESLLLLQDEHLSLRRTNVFSMGSLCQQDLCKGHKTGILDRGGSPERGTMMLQHTPDNTLELWERDHSEMPYEVALFSPRDQAPQVAFFRRGQGLGALLLLPSHPHYVFSPPRPFPNCHDKQAFQGDPWVSFPLTSISASGAQIGFGGGSK